MFSFLYNTLLLVFSFLFLPKFIWRSFTKGKYKKSFTERLGKVSGPFPKKQQKTIWVHAVSVGEVKSISRLAKKLKTEDPSVFLIVSTTTETGQEEAERCIPVADKICFLPFDFTFCISRVIKAFKPDYLLLSETDLWWNFQSKIRANGGCVALLSGKLSKRSAKNYKTFSFFSARLFGSIDAFGVQTQQHAELFEWAGVDRKKIKVTGNLKFDDHYTEMSEGEKKVWRGELGIRQGDPVVVFGSSHPQEEELFLRQMLEVWKRKPRVKVIIVPRHPERFDEVSSILERFKLVYARYTDVEAKPISGNEQVLLLDVMGVLRKAYQIADIAIIAGSFTGLVGGHNILEPTYYGVPSIFGPFMYAQEEMKTLVLSNQAGLQVAVNELEKVLLRFFRDPLKFKEMGKRGLKLSTDLKGSLHKTYCFLEKEFFF